MTVRRSPDRKPLSSAPYGGDLHDATDSSGSLLVELRSELGELRSQLAGHEARVSELEAAIPDLEDKLRRSVYDVRDRLAARDSQTGTEIAYRQLVRRIREVVCSAVPRRAIVIVVGKADTDVLDLYGRDTRAFPQTADGRYAGYYPACSTAAIAHLEAVRSSGADYLLIPENARWWLQHYGKLRRHLEARYRLVIDQKDTCLIFSLREAPAANSVWHELEDLVGTFQRRYGRDPAILDWNTGLDLAAKLPQETVFSPPTSDPILPYLENSIDIVALSSGDSTFASEADRVASAAILTFFPNTGQVVVRWKSEAATAIDAPVTSIIIPAFNGSAHTAACLAALNETLPRCFKGEIIVVDDGSTDDTVRRVQQSAKVDPRLKVVRNRTNIGFVRSCNAGAQASSGELLVFLNSDTLPLPGWLPALWRAFHDRPDAGAVGGKLIYPDGRLQEAGGLVFCDGSATNFGRGDYNPDLPLYNFLREVDYCSAALLATPRSLFAKLAGFDTYYAPGYYEDTDYCFRVREHGFRVYYQPESAVVHVEGGTAGIDLSGGMKRYQVLNQVKFLERWGRALQRQPARPARLDFAALHALAVRQPSDGRTPS